jgi:hypothetical protein
MIRVQMVGTQRSGSNLLRLMLGQSPTIYTPPSEHVMETFTPIIDTYGSLDWKPNLIALVDDVLELIRRNALKWEDGPPQLADVIEFKPSSLAGTLKAIYDVGADQKGCEAWVNKSLENFQYLNRADCHDIRFVHLIRDGRDVALSFLNAPIGPKEVHVIARKWKMEQDGIRALAATHKVTQVRYEDLISSPVDTIRDLCLKLGLPVAERPDHFFVGADAASASSLSPLWQNLNQPVIAGNQGKFRAPEYGQIVQNFEAVAGSTLEQYGYGRLTGHENDESRVDWAVAERDDAKLRRKIFEEQSQEQRAPHEEYHAFRSTLGKRQLTHAGKSSRSMSQRDVS